MESLESTRALIFHSIITFYEEVIYRLSANKYVNDDEFEIQFGEFRVNLNFLRTLNNNYIRP